MTAERTKKICKRCGKLGLECLAIVVAIFLAAGLFLSWQLSKGPIDIGPLIPHIEAGLRYEDKGIELKLGGASLAWASLDSPPQIQISDVEIRKLSGPPIALISKLGITVVPKELLYGRIMIDTATVFEPALKIHRNEDGSFAFDIGADVKLPQGDNTDVSEDTAFITTLLSGMGAEKDRRRLGGDLSQVSIVNAWLGYQDRKTGTSWVSPRTDILVTRDTAGIAVQSRMDLELGDDNVASVQARLLYNSDNKASKLLGTFKGIDPRALSEKNPAFAPLKALAFKLNGSMNMMLDENFVPVEAIISLNGENGNLDIPAAYDAPVPVKATALELHYDLLKHAATLRNFTLDLDGPKAVVTGTMHKTDGNLLETNLEATLTDMPIDLLDQYWPHKLGTQARTWVTKNLSAGTAQTATLKAVGTAPAEDPFALSLKDLSGDIAFSGLTVNYLNPMPVVTDVGGTASYTQNDFTLDLTSGTLKDMTVSKSDIAITNIIREPGDHSQIDIGVALSGPVKTALTVLDSEPLGYTSQLGLTPETTEGTTDVAVNFKFPLHKSLSMNEVNVAAKATLKDVLFKNMVAGLDVTGGPLDLAVNRSEMDVSGEALLGGTPARFAWKKNFDKDEELQSQVEASLNLNKAMRLKFGVDFEDWILGNQLPITVLHTLNNDKTETLFVRGDATPTVLAQPELGYLKPKGQKASIEAMVHLKNQTPERVSGLKIISDDLHLDGEVTLAPDQSIAYLNFPTFKMGATDASLEGEAKLDGSFEYLFRGMTLDATTLLEKTPGVEQFRKAEPPQRMQPISISFELSNLITGKDRGLYDVKAYIQRNTWGRIERLEIDGKSGGGDIYARYLPTEDGKHTLRFEAGNAGAALRALDISNVIEGGVLVVNGEPIADGGPRDLQGSVQLSNFRIVNLPLLARLLNGLSLTGFGELLSGSGIAFKRLRSGFIWRDTVWAAGQPGQQILGIRNGRTSGSSLGLTVEGKINYSANRYDLDGTIVPISGVNKLIGEIPIVGDILTGGSDAVFAATYTIKGPSTDPTITVNPLAALAPGLLRKILFED